MGRKIPDKEKVARHMAKKDGISILEAQRRLESVIGSISDVLIEEKVLKLRGFLNFKIVRRDAKETINPATGGRMIIEETNSVVIRPSKPLKKRVLEVEM